MRYWYVNTEDPSVSFEENSTSNGGPMEHYPGNIWTGDNESWATRVGAIEKTKEEAQDLVNTALEGVVWGEYADVNLVGKPVVIILP
jgi:hypothetical protein